MRRWLEPLCKGYLVWMLVMVLVILTMELVQRIGLPKTVGLLMGFAAVGAILYVAECDEGRKK